MSAIPQSRQAILAALYRDTALLGDSYCNESDKFIPGYEYNSAVATSHFDRLISGYRLIFGYPGYIEGSSEDSLQIVVSAQFRSRAKRF